MRVVRNVKGRKHSKYAPAEGNRYDGIYKVSGPACPRRPRAAPGPPRCRRRPLPAGREVLAGEGQVRLPGVALPAPAGRRGTRSLDEGGEGPDQEVGADHAGASGPGLPSLAREPRSGLLWPNARGARSCPATRLVFPAGRWGSGQSLPPGAWGGGGPGQRGPAFPAGSSPGFL